MSHISARAYTTARHWASHRGNVAQVVVEGIAQQAQDHMDHGADPDYLDRIVIWMHLNQPSWQDLDLAMRYDSAPKPDAVAAGGHPCACRGGTYKTRGAPAPPIVRQLIRRSTQRPTRAPRRPAHATLNDTRGAHR